MSSKELRSTLESSPVSTDYSNMSKEELLEEIQNTKQELDDSREINQKFIESSYDGFWDWYIQDNYEYMSPRFWEIFGFLPHEKEHSPEAWQDLIFQEDLPLVLENFEKHVATKGKHIFAQEARYCHKDGSTVHVMCRGSVIKWDEEGKPLRMIGTHTDITELRKSEAENLNYLKQVERSNEELESFSHVVSHDLKEPLRGIRNYSKRLLEDYESEINEDGQKKLSSMLTLSTRLESMISDLLHYSQVGKINDAYTQVNLNESLQHLEESLHVAFEEKNVHLKMDKNFPQIYCDRVRIGEVFRNLITNALKYNESATPEIELGWTPNKDDLSNGYTFYVKDNGIGIREKHLDSVFSIFKRLHGKDKYGGGTGAGLTIVKKIVEQHGGKIWVESEPNKGSTFFFTISPDQDKSLKSA